MAAVLAAAPWTAADPPAPRILLPRRSNPAFSCPSALPSTRALYASALSRIVGSGRGTRRPCGPPRTRAPSGRGRAAGRYTGRSWARRRRTCRPPSLSAKRLLGTPIPRDGAAQTLTFPLLFCAWWMYPWRILRPPPPAAARRRLRRQTLPLVELVGIAPAAPRPVQGRRPRFLLPCPAPRPPATAAARRGLGRPMLGSLGMRARSVAPLPVRATRTVPGRAPSLFARITAVRWSTRRLW